MKSNRTIAISLEDKVKGKLIQINQLSSLYSAPAKVYLKGIEFPMKLMKKVFKNEDESEGILYLITNEMKKMASRFTKSIKNDGKLKSTTSLLNQMPP